jgi:hypothetical protein
LRRALFYTLADDLKGERRKEKEERRKKEGSEEKMKKADAAEAVHQPCW